MSRRSGPDSWVARLQAQAEQASREIEERFNHAVFERANIFSERMLSVPSSQATWRIVGAVAMGSVAHMVVLAFMVLTLALPVLIGAALTGVSKLLGRRWGGPVESLVSDVLGAWLELWIDFMAFVFWRSVGAALFFRSAVAMMGAAMGAGLALAQRPSLSPRGRFWTFVGMNPFVIASQAVRRNREFWMDKGLARDDARAYVFWDDPELSLWALEPIGLWGWIAVGQAPWSTPWAKLSRDAKERGARTGGGIVLGTYLCSQESRSWMEIMSARAESKELASACAASVARKAERSGGASSGKPRL